jgi:hypothetical protein
MHIQFWRVFFTHTFWPDCWRPNSQPDCCQEPQRTSCRPIVRNRQCSKGAAGASTIHPGRLFRWSGGEPNPRNMRAATSPRNDRCQVRLSGARRPIDSIGSIGKAIMNDDTADCVLAAAELKPRALPLGRRAGTGEHARRAQAAVPSAAY